METKLTVIVPIHNMHKKINRLKDWISTINESEIQLILVDDFTSDESSREIKDLITCHSTLDVELVSGRFGSPGAARNAGLSKVRGLWVIFVDSDDVLFPTAVFNHLVKSELNAIEVFQFRELDFGSGEIRRALSNTSSDIDLVTNLGIWRIAFPAKFLADKRFTEIRMGEDLLYFLDVVEDNPKIKFNQIHGYDYLIGSGSQLTADEGALNDLINLLDCLHLKIATYKNAKTLAKLSYFKNTLSAAKYLGLLKSLRFISKNVKIFLSSDRGEKKKFVQIVKKLVK